MRKISAARFKATCLSLLDEVARTGETIVILKRGKVVAELSRPRSKKDPLDDLKGSVTILGDIVSPVMPPEAWHANRGKH